MAIDDMFATSTAKTSMNAMIVECETRDIHTL